jgi:chromate transporter
LHFLSLSLLSIGGAITTVPDMHRFLVGEKSWLSDSQFTGSIALAQAAPGPNVLFVAVLGWNIGMNAGGGIAGGASAWGMAFAGVFATMLGILLPSTTLTFFAARWGHQNKERRDVRAFKMSMAPIVVALLMATGWILTVGHGPFLENLWLWVLTLVSTLVVWQTRIHLLWLLAAGALGGVMGWF